ncbi:MAG TPA: tetrahydromethanopterin S-methyltransferase subunit C [Candidatus Acidoferrales bacterium]|nr:tetrahydromethanopterin S-methyltransferase subunit C [Candidatus Acidoferrales bacterium]
MAEGDQSPRRLMTIGIVGALIGIYLANYLNILTGTAVFSFLAALGAILAVYYGADAVRRVASYGLGTGVPSIGMLSIGAGQVAVLLGLAVAKNYNIEVAAPIIALILAAIIGIFNGVMARRVIKMNIAIMEMSMTEIAMAASMLILGFSTTIAGSFAFDKIMSYVVASGFIIAVFIVGGMAMLHPFNACLGPDERQRRTLDLALSTGFIAMLVSGIAAGAINGVQAAVPTLIVAIFGWIIYYLRFYADTKEDAAAILSTGLIPKEEELA